MNVFAKPVPQLVFLGILGGAALILAAILAFSSNEIDVWEYTPTEQVQLKAGLAAWADILMITGIIASVGAIVLDGVLHLMRRLVATPETTTSTEDAA